MTGKDLVCNLLATVSLLLSSSYGYAQNGKVVTDEWLVKNYTKREVLVQVRDGAHIYASVFEIGRAHV